MEQFTYSSYTLSDTDIKTIYNEGKGTNVNNAYDLIGLSVNSAQNLVSLKTGLHRRLHTNTYYGFAKLLSMDAVAPY